MTRNRPTAGFSLLEVMIASTIMVGVLVMTFQMIAAGQRSYDYGVANTLHLTVGRKLMDHLTQELRNAIKSEVHLFDRPHVFGDEWTEVLPNGSATTITGCRIRFRQSMGFEQPMSDPVVFYLAMDTGEGTAPDGIDSDGDGFIDESKLTRWRDYGPAISPTTEYWTMAGAPTPNQLANDQIISLGRWIATGLHENNNTVRINEIDYPANHGTVSLFSGSKNVSGVDTCWKTSFNGALLSVGLSTGSTADDFSSPIQAVTNLPGNTLVLADAYPMTNLSGATYDLRQYGLTFTWDGGNHVTVAVHVEVKDNYGIIVESTIVQEVILRNN